jgi:hypothetical protein
MKHNIDHVLDKYWAGESSIEDEVILKEYFSNDDILETHRPFKELFVFFNEQGKIEYTKVDTGVDYTDLLEKYFEGETSDGEELILKDYFRSNAVKDEHKLYTALFEYFDTQRNITYAIVGNEAEVSKPKVIYFRLRKIIYSVAAASVLLFCAVTVMKEFNPDPIEHQAAMVNEIEDPEEALRVTKEALALVSKKFRASQKTVRENMGSLEKAAIFK